MGVHRHNTAKRQTWAQTARVKREALPRIIRQNAKLRARKPMPLNSLNYIQHPDTTEDTLKMRTAPPPLPYPLIAKRPLVDPASWRKLPQTLDRPPMPEIDTANIAAVQPAYEGISAFNVRESWTWLGYKVLGLFQKLYVDPPKAALPAAFNVLVKDSGLACNPTHVFGVYSFVPTSSATEPMARQLGECLKFRREVALFPTHAAIWAAHCARLPRMQPAGDVPVMLVREPREGVEAASCVRLPVIPVVVPYPPMFYALELYVYTRQLPLFIAQLLVCAGHEYIDPYAIVGSEPFELLVRDLAKAYNMSDLGRLAKNVFGAYENMLMLGMVDDGLWVGIDYAWKALLKAMSIVEGQGEKLSALRMADVKPRRRRPGEIHQGILFTQPLMF